MDGITIGDDVWHHRDHAQCGDDGGDNETDGEERMIGDYFTATEACRYVRLSRAGLNRHIYKVGDLKADRRLGKNLLFSRVTLDRFNLERGTVGRPMIIDIVT